MIDDGVILEMIESMYSSRDLEATFDRITHTAVALVDAVDHASITINRAGNLSTHGPTSVTALQADTLQYQEKQGPCLDAVTRDRWVLTPDVLTDQRWPRFSARLADELSVHGMLSIRLSVATSPQRNLGGLNLYSNRSGAFDIHQRNLALVLGALASVATDAARTHEEMTAAVEGRQVIGEAIGILRAQSNLTRDQAFEALSHASQRMNIKLRDVAAAIADGTPGAGASPGGTAASPAAGA